MNTPQHSTQREPELNRRCALFTLLAMTLAIGMGFLAWGPIPLQASVHSYADARTLAGLANGVNAMLSLPMLLAGLWGWRVLERSHWPAALQMPWRGCFGCIALAAVVATAYHLAPGDLAYLAAQAAAAGAFMLLLCGFLAERVDARFGSPRSCAAALGVVVLATCASVLGDVPDLRPLLLLQLLPVLLIPAGALSLPGSHTLKADWLLILGLYALARVCDLGDGNVMRATGGLVSGHALMHLCLAGVAAWLAYRARPASATADDGAAQATTSLSTSG